MASNNEVRAPGKFVSAHVAAKTSEWNEWIRQHANDYRAMETVRQMKRQWREEADEIWRRQQEEISESLMEQLRAEMEAMRAEMQQPASAPETPSPEVQPQQMMQPLQPMQFPQPFQNAQSIPQWNQQQQSQLPQWVQEYGGQQVDGGYQFPTGTMDRVRGLFNQPGGTPQLGVEPQQDTQYNDTLLSDLLQAYNQQLLGGGAV